MLKHDEEIEYTSGYRAGAIDADKLAREDERSRLRREIEHVIDAADRLSRTAELLAAHAEKPRPGVMTIWEEDFDALCAAQSAYASERPARMTYSRSR